jgi:hypothetical protein
MKNEFIKYTFGWIRGPKKTKIMVRYLQSNSGIKLSSGVSVSQHFGFLQQTRVILSYVIQENTFWMKILPPIQSVKIENTTDPIIVGPSHNEGMQHQTNELGGTSNNQHKPTPTKTQFRKVIFIISFQIL